MQKKKLSHNTTSVINIFKKKINECELTLLLNFLSSLYSIQLMGVFFFFLKIIVKSVLGWVNNFFNKVSNFLKLKKKGDFFL